MKNKILLTTIIVLILSILIINISAEDLKKDCKIKCLKLNKENILNSTEKLSNCIETIKNNSNCSSIYDIKERNICFRSQNKNKEACKKENKQDLTKIRSDYTYCSTKCNYITKNITCENKKYNAGDYFLEECNLCKCSFNGKIQCITSSFCNFEENSYFISKDTCETNNGLYQQVCAGEGYSKQCSRDYFCQCEGTFNYTCPTGYYCLKNFTISNIKRSYFSLGKIRLPGIPLGDSGICVKKSSLTSCGNGICENICTGTNCTSAESSINCPEDCK